MLGQFFNLAYDSYDLQRICQLILLGGTGLYLLVDQPLRQASFFYFERLVSYQKLLLALFFILGILSSLHAVEPVYALMEVSTFFLLLVFGFTFAGALLLEKDRLIKHFNYLIITLSIISAFIALLSWISFKSNPELSNSLNQAGTLSYFLPAPGYMNPRFFDDANIFLIPLLLSLVFYFDSKTLRILILFLVSLSFARGLSGASRIYFYDPLALFIVLPLIFRKRALPFLSLLLICILAGLLLYEVLYTWGIGQIPKSITLISLDHRTLLWKIAFHLIATHPFLGVGPLHYGLYAFSTENYAAHPHSFILALCAEWGLLAFSLAAFLTLNNLLHFVKQAPRTENTPTMIGLTAAFTGGFLMMSIDGLALMPPGQILLALSMGLAIFNCAQFHSLKLLCLASKRFDRSLIVLILLALALVAWSVLPMISALPQMNAIYLNSCKINCTLSPNYWSQGFVQFY